MGKKRRSKAPRVFAHLPIHGASDPADVLVDPLPLARYLKRACVEIPAEPEWATEPDPDRALRAHLARLGRSSLEMATEAGVAIPGPDERLGIDRDSLRGHLWQALRDIRRAQIALDSGDALRAGLAAVSATEHHSIALDRLHVRPDWARGKADRQHATDISPDGGRGRGKKFADANDVLCAWAKHEQEEMSKRRAGPEPRNIRARIAKKLHEDGRDPLGRPEERIYRVIGSEFKKPTP